jgi:hypothetical protein
MLFCREIRVFREDLRVFSAATLAGAQKTKQAYRKLRLQQKWTRPILAAAACSYGAKFL